MTDAVLETKKIVETAAKLQKENINISKERYTFEYPGSTQGFGKCDYPHGAGKRKFSFRIQMKVEMKMAYR